MIKKTLAGALAATLLLGTASVQAEDIPKDKKSPMDKYPESLLYSKVQKVSDRVYVSVGDTYAATYSNAGHNNNGTFIIGDDAVFVVNTLSSYKLAKALHDEIKKITDLPVKYAIVENGQRHAVLGTGYWQEQGAIVYGHVDAAEEIKHMGENTLNGLRKNVKENMDGTEIKQVDKTFEDEVEFDLGGVTATARYIGPGHSPGDISVYVNDIVIAGDMAFHVRMLPVFPDTNTAEWLETWNDVFTDLAQDKIIIPRTWWANGFCYS